MRMPDDLARLRDPQRSPAASPSIRLHGALADWFDARGLRAHVTVTDETDYAASFVVVETREPVTTMTPDHAPVVLDIAGTALTPTTAAA